MTRDQLNATLLAAPRARERGRWMAEPAGELAIRVVAAHPNPEAITGEEAIQLVPALLDPPRGTVPPTLRLGGVETTFEHRQVRFDRKALHYSPRVTGLFAPDGIPVDDGVEERAADAIRDALRARRFKGAGLVEIRPMNRRTAHGFSMSSVILDSPEGGPPHEEHHHLEHQTDARIAETVEAIAGKIVARWKARHALAARAEGARAWAEAVIAATPRAAGMEAAGGRITSATFNADGSLNDAMVAAVRHHGRRRPKDQGADGAAPQRGADRPARHRPPPREQPARRGGRRNRTTPSTPPSQAR